MTGSRIIRGDLHEAALLAARAQAQHAPTPTAVAPHRNGERLINRAIPRAVALTRGIRDSVDATWVDRILGDLDRDELAALAITLAALCPPDVDPDTDLAWVDLPASEWPDSLVIREANRGRRGATDGVAAMAAHEYRRRSRAGLEALTAEAGGAS